MSARMLKDLEGCVHELRDDLESFAHVLFHQVCQCVALLIFRLTDEV